MSRIYKFRAWNQHKMIGFPFIVDISASGIVTIITKDMTYANVKLMQFTGLKDCKGKEIYEGDVVRHIGRHKPTFSVDDKLINYPSETVEFIDGAFQPVADEVWMSHGKIEIIGNVYEHSHLLEKGTK